MSNGHGGWNLDNQPEPKSGGRDVFGEYVGKRLTAEQIAAREALRHARWGRNVTATFFGDPPAGYSALERKRAADAAREADPIARYRISAVQERRRMALLGFSAIMAPKVENLIKLQTIRKYRKDGRDPEEGDLLQLYTGLRRPGARKLLEHDPICEVAGHITIGDMRDKRYHGAPLCSVLAAWPRDTRTIDGDLRLWHPRELDDFARADGFRDFDQLLAWFKPGDEGFRGTLTMWRPRIETLLGWRPSGARA